MYAVCKLFQPSTYKYQVTSGLDSLAIANEVHQRARWSSKLAQDLLRRPGRPGPSRLWNDATAGIVQLASTTSPPTSEGSNRRCNDTTWYNAQSWMWKATKGSPLVKWGTCYHVFNVRAAFKSEMSGSRPYQGVELRGFWIYVDWEFGVPVQFMQFMQPRLFFRCS